MKLLIDSDIILFMACCSTEYTTYHHPTEGRFRYKKELDGYLRFNHDDDDELLSTEIARDTVTEPIKNTYRALDTIIEGLVRKTGADSYLLVVKGEQENFRKDLPYPVVYKGTRPPKPSNYGDATAYLKELPNVHPCTGPWEVDDELGILQDKDNPTTPSTIIATTDKDVLYGIPGLKWDIGKDLMFYTPEDEAEKFFWLQMLMGDRVDNVQGLDGIGPKKAAKLLDGCVGRSSFEAVVRSEYQKAFPDNWELMYSTNQRLLWILRHPLNGD